MNKKQKYCLISHILVWGGISTSIFSIIFLLIYSMIFDNYEVNLIHFILFILIIIGVFVTFFAPKYNPMYQIGYYSDPTMKLLRSKAGLIEGVPNNPYDEFNFNFKNLSENNILFEEFEKGMFERKGLDKKLKFDMRYWIRKKYYIYEYFMTKLQIEISNQITKKAFLSENKFTHIEDINLIIKNNKGKVKKYALVINYKTKPNFMFRYRIRQKWRVIDNIDKKTIETFYNFN